MTLSQNAIQYTVTQLMKIALPNIEVRSIKMDETGTISLHLSHDISLVFKLLDSTNAKLLLAGTLLPTLLPAFNESDTIPFFAPAPQPDKFCFVKQNVCVFNYDLITLPFLLLSNYEAYAHASRDCHDRQRFAGSISDKYAIIDIPIVDYYAHCIRKIVMEHFPAIPIKQRDFGFIVTHDIDELFRFGSLLRVCKTILGGDIWVRKSLKYFKQSVSQALKTGKNPINDPYITGLKLLIESVQKRQISNVEQIVFIKGLICNEPDATYNVRHPIVAQLVDYLKEKNVKIGLHAGYHSYDNAKIYKQECQRLADLLLQPITYGRQHFLRYNPDITPQIWQQCGLQHDYTLGFAEREGFRCGTCHPYLLYDNLKDCVTKITEHPLIVMDGTFFQYQQTTPEAAYQKMHSLYETCRRVEGDFVLLWHNTVVYRDFESWYNNCFAHLTHIVASTC